MLEAVTQSPVVRAPIGLNERHRTKTKAERKCRRGYFHSHALAAAPMDAELIAHTGVVLATQVCMCLYAE